MSHSFSIPRGPRRIVCLTEEPTEILYCLGEDERVVGISASTVRPPEARRDKPAVSAFVGGSVETISALEPDLVVGFSDVQAEWASQLISANLPVLIFNQRSVQEILEVILSLGRLVGAHERAEGLVASYIARLDAASSRAQKRSARPRVYFEEWDDPMICGIEWISELIEIAGGTDVFREKARGKAARDRFVSEEVVAEASPDIMLAAWCGKPLDRESVLSRPGMQQVPAIANERVWEVPAELILQPGPACLTDGLDYLERLLHGDGQEGGASRA